MASAVLTAACAVAVVAPLLAQAKQDPREEAARLVKRTMLDRSLHPKTFRGGEWEGRGEAYLALEASPSGSGTDVVRYRTETGAREVLVPAARLKPEGAASPLAIEEYRVSADGRLALLFTNTQTVWRRNTRGDYWLFDVKSGALHKLGGGAPAASLMFAKFSPDGTRVAYVSRNNVYVEDVATHKITQLTRDGSATIINGTSDWVYEEEFDLRDGFEWSPDGKSIAFWHFDTASVQRYAITYDLGPPRGPVVTGFSYPGLGVYPQTLEYDYPLAGMPNSAVRAGVVSAAGGNIVWLEATGDPRESYIPRMDWADAGHVLLQHMNRLQNRNEFLLADAATGATRTLFVDEDRAWVNANDEVRWVHHGREFLVESERDGWRHLYRVALDTGTPALVTRGNFDVVDVLRVTPDEQWVYFVASPDNATQRYLYRTRLDGSAAPERITPDVPGTHGYQVSPDCEWAFHNFSSFNAPPHSDVVHLPDHRVARVTADNAALAETVKAFTSGPAEFTKVDAGDGLMVDAWVLKPPAFDPAKHYALIVHVYSEPAGQTTADHWPSNAERMLAAAGYVVASFDNQGTPAPRGREWRKAVYGDIGPLSSKQQSTALQALEKTRPYIDPKRVGVWGWSGGGTETLNLMFRYPDVYAVGVSVASVPDQRLYDTVYQERYLGLPQLTPQAYEKSSAINFVEGLRGNLLVMHGSGDDNVHFQGFELLVNKLIALGKPFDMRVYPGRTHSISEGEGTTLDVYTNILAYFQTHLPAGPRP